MTTVETSGTDSDTVRANKLGLVERLADDLAHEIKNPLHSMVINLEVLRRRIDRLEGDKSELLRFAGVIGGELDRVTRRIELLMRLIRPDRSGEPVTLQEVVEEFLELLELERERHGVALDFEPAASPLRSRLAREPARQMVLNLLLAALDATPAGGRVLVTTEPAAGRMLLRVRALPPEGLPAPDAAPAASEPHRLAVARALAEQLDGELEARGDATAGAEFVVALPAGAAA